MIQSWLAIGVVTFLVAITSNLFLSPEDYRWFNRLQRPRWLTFERSIPLIWTIVFICGAWSAYLVWEQDPGSSTSWTLMGVYLLLELVTLAYTPVMCKRKSLRAGTIVGGIGAMLSVILALKVWRVSLGASLLLLPYILWSPIGTYTTWAMIRLNRPDR